MTDSPAGKNRGKCIPLYCCIVKANYHFRTVTLIILGVQMFNRILRYSSYQITELQIKWGVEDKSKIFFLVSQRNYIVYML